MTKNSDDIWPKLQKEAADVRDPLLAEFIKAFVTDHANLSDALGFMLSEGLARSPVTSTQLRKIIAESHKTEPRIVSSAQRDLVAVTERDPATKSALEPFLFFKGFQALQAYRVAHWLWIQNRKTLALYIQSRMSQCFAIDIHPAAVIGQGIMMDHAHGIVIGETAVVEDDVSMLHEVTLGGTYKIHGDRHPKVRKGAMIGVGAKILGNIEIGAGSRIAPGSVVVKNVPANVIVAGIPGRVIGVASSTMLGMEMDQMFGADEGSSI